MILADTSIWVEHLRKGSPALSELLREGSVVIHPFIIEELACGNLSHRKEILELLEALPQAPVASHKEFLLFIEKHRLQNSGLGAIDVHLLASSQLAHAKVWTHDKRLKKASESFKA